MRPQFSMTRRVAFSSGHRYWNSNLGTEGNRELFGRWASPFNHGHNFVLDASVTGPLDEVTGMITNIKRIDAILRERIVQVFDQRSLNDEVDAFSTEAPCIENLLRYIHRSVPADVDGAEWTGFRLQEMPGFFGELERSDNGDWIMTITRTYEFAAAQRLHSENLTAEENRKLYGICNNEEGYGHNYILEVTLTGEPDPRTGFLCNIEAFDKAVKEHVIDRLDHRCLFRDIPELQDMVTTCENILQFVQGQLQGKLPARLHRLRLWETARNMFELSIPIIEN